MIKRLFLLLCLGLLPASLSGQAVLKVNEVSTANPSWIEIVNLGTPINVGGYIVRAGGNSGITFLQGSYTIPSMTLGTNQVLVLTEDVSAVLPAVPAGVFKAYCGFSIPWAATPATGANGVVALNDPTDVGLDRMRWGNPLQDFSIYGSPWSSTITATASAMYRNTPVDTNTPADWVSTGTPTPGVINPGEANVLNLQLVSTPGLGDLTLTVTSIGPAVPFGEIFNLASLINTSPDGSGPIFGVGADVLLQPTMGYPFHTNLDANGVFQLATGPGALPFGLHLEVVSLLLQGSITRISMVKVVTI